MADTFTAILDSCVLYPFALRDLLVQLATTDLFRARWTASIHDEWMRAVEAERPELRGRLQRTRELMDASVLDCVVTGYEGLIDGLTLPDPKDRHVLAAAIRAGAQVIVTRNLRDFPESALRPFGVEAQHPDEFVGCLLDLSPGAVCASAKMCRERLRNPGFSVEEFLAMLARQELVGTVAVLRQYAASL